MRLINTHQPITVIHRPTSCGSLYRVMTVFTLSVLLIAALLSVIAYVQYNQSVNPVQRGIDIQTDQLLGGQA